MTNTERLELAAQAEQIANDLDIDPDAFKEHHPGERARFQAALRTRAAELRAKARGLTPVKENGVIIGGLSRTSWGTWEPFVLSADGGYQPVGFGWEDVPSITEADQMVRREHALLVRMGDRPDPAKAAPLPKRIPGATRVQAAIDQYKANRSSVVL